VTIGDVIARVHSVHLMNVVERQAAAEPQTKRDDLGSESASRLYGRIINTNSVIKYYLARNTVKAVSILSLYRKLP